jgi:hypothetical protein
LCFQFSVGYSLIWFRGANFPPLATTGSVNDLVPGALGQPGTVILSEGPRNPGPSAAFRATFTYWILDPERVSLDGDFFIMEQRSIYNHFASDATGNPPLFRPFFDPLNGVFGGENSDPRALPGVLSGTLSDSIRTRLMSADLNLRWHSSPHMEGSRASIFVGARWLRLDERYLSNDTALDIGGGGFLFNFSDNFTTYNQFFGGQVGADWNYQLGRFTLGLFTKVAVGPNYQTIKINGQATATDLSTGQVITDDTQALFAQPSNIGNYRKTQISVLSEFGAKTQIELNERIRLHCGYSFLWMTNTVRPGDQMDRVINNRQLPIGGAGAGLPNLPPALPGPPTFNQSQFYGHMLNLGLEITF